jgi:secreted trypsin-like serine protease
MTIAWLRHRTTTALLAVALGGCAELADSDTAVDDTATTEQAIIGGTEATPGEYPWQVQLRIPGYAHWCGGSIIDDDWVVTAAHCVAGKTAADFTVRAGLHRRTAPDGNVQVRTVSRIVSHPSYNPSTIENDVALLQLASPLTYTPRVQPIALRTTGSAVGTVAPVSGWGQTAPGSASADPLQETFLPVQSTATCNAAGTLPLLVRPGMLCAGYVGGEHGGCHGDSGGPLVAQRNVFSGGWELIGIVSWGVGGSCSSYTVFTRVATFAAWIAAQTGPVEIYGDVDGSGCVDSADEAAIIASFGLSVPPAAPALDLNHDGVVNVHDRLLVLQNFHQGCP